MKLRMLPAIIASIISSSVSANVFISEYIEGSGNNKAIELYNNSGQAQNLDGYALKFYFNGSTSAGTTIDLSGHTIEPNSTFVISHADAVFAGMPYINLTNSASWFNGDDAIILENGEQVIDSIGQLGVDPGSQWSDGVASTQNNTLRRAGGIQAGDTVADDAFYPSVEWDEYEQDNSDHLGQFGTDDTVGEPDTGDSSLVCGVEATPIHTIQGSSDVSALVDQPVQIEAIVTFLAPDLGGFFVQMADNEVDANASTSEGLFIYSANATTDVDVAVGERVRLQGTVGEYYNKTQLTNVQAFEVCATDQILPSPALVSLPVSSSEEWEQWEGMQLAFEQSLVVNETYNLARYGLLTLGSKRAFIPTQVATPGNDAVAMSLANDLDQILIDDASNTQNPAHVVYPSPGLAADNTVRVGDTVSGLIGVLDYSYSEWKVMPAVEPVFEPTNPRTEYPELLHQGNVTVASFNVLNYFNGDGLTGENADSGFPTARGASTVEEFIKQQAKIVSAISRIDADIVGLMEIENDGYGEQSAIASLVAALNAHIGEGTYAFVSPGRELLGDDDIAVGLIYKPARVSLSGPAIVLDEANSPLDNSGAVLFDTTKNRPVLTQQFGVLPDEGSLVVAVNHFKSKGSDCEALNDPDLGDGQGNCNLTRTRAAKALGEWLNNTYGEEQGSLIIGDLNSYAKEDPITALAEFGYNNLADTLNIQDFYTYVYDGETGQLDHALANAALQSSAVYMTAWHINTDEPRALDYNEEYKTSDQVIDYFSADPYRSSDHDPVIVELALSTLNTAPEADFTFKANRNGRVNFKAWAQDEDGKVVSYRWDLGNGQTAKGRRAHVNYRVAGDYDVTLTVVDDQGATTQVTKTVHVESPRQTHFWSWLSYLFSKWF
ncbi:ExeM/NucH family extracellular endonuclease [Neptunomonas phycophila]|uniref:ExeM/NucH family extracellular endonuclease n=1 Tax=Neptunomonas phycophila TaxID=1572645 RepID=UPI0015BA88DA|nr:ExeM/NucH family extracellular endonuclease [Neptunomonas phycophila]QLE97825.1 ExeM/NucH family extracellular endonuclease [Neptunomonas phycophila]